ncbi:hypothetical protein [Raoultella ornithinolytica]|uniref:bestrophin-like domain n=1 Tax=Raoultella ornithinolytica TaxID=54291 RepID=UPI0021B08C6C|nr:hypothetical protein [Raoultella ornithinolytica]MCT4737236.1 hypothetical protein [Raoultella ornithinolytica]
MAAYFLMLPTADDILLLAVIFTALIMVAYTGRFIACSWTEGRSTETAITTGGALTLSGLLIGFVFSVSLSGYSAREKAEVREAQSVASAWQYTLLLPVAMQHKLHPLLQKYLDDRICFFKEVSAQGSRGWSRTAEDNQRQQWQLLVPEAIHAPGAVMASVLSAFSALMTTEKQTRAVWKRQIPDEAWLVLVVFAVSACFLTGQQYSQRDIRHFYLLLLPVLLSLVLFIIAEIDIPGTGIIRVTPDALEQLSAAMIPTGSGRCHGVSVPVHHVP